jgi:hypothetical protein
MDTLRVSNTLGGSAATDCPLWHTRRDAPDRLPIVEQAVSQCDFRKHRVKRELARQNFGDPATAVAVSRRKSGTPAPLAGKVA